MRGRIMEDDDVLMVETEEDTEMVTKTRSKGRGFTDSTQKTLVHHHHHHHDHHPTIHSSPLRSVEGWIILVTGVHEDTEEDDLLNAFGQFGEVKNLHLNLDRRTGFVKGYALIEYESFEAAKAAISGMNGAVLFGQIICVDWAFRTGSSKGRIRPPLANRSRSPSRRY